MWELRADLTEKEIEAAATNAGLDIGSKGTLGKYPGSVHWHFRSPMAKGTAEVTLLVAKSRCWLEVRSNRASHEMLELAERFAKMLR